MNALPSSVHGSPRPRPAPLFYRWGPADDHLHWLGGEGFLFGYAIEELPRTRTEWWSLLHPEDRPEAEERIAQLFQQQGTGRLEYRLRNREGGYALVAEEVALVNENLVVGNLHVSGCSAFLDAGLQNTLESVGLGVLLIDPDGTIRFANESVRGCFGYLPGELVGRSVEDLIPAALRSQHVDLRAQYLRNPERRQMLGREIRALRKDGTEVAIAVGLGTLSVGGDIKIACTVLELTTLKQAERDLERFFDLSPDLFCIANLNGYFVRVNSNFSRILGYPSSTMLATPFREFAHPEDRERIDAEVAKLACGETMVRYRARCRNHAGGYVWLEWTARATTEDGMIFAVARNVSENVDLENELNHRQDREQTILDNTTAVVYVKEAGGRYQFVNQRFLELFRLRREDVLGRRDDEVFPPEFATMFMENDRQVIAAGERMSVSEAAPHPDGPHQYISVKMPLFGPNGEAIALAGISTDITEQIKAQDATQQLELAHVFQDKLYPVSAPAVSGLDIAGQAAPVSQVCGDYFDYIPRSPASLAVCVGDVSGHGFAPALQMVEVRTAMRIHLRNRASLSFAVNELNHLLCEDLPIGSFVTLFLVEVDVPNRELRYIGAGHLAYLFRASGEIERLWSTGPVLGLDDTACFDEVGVVPFHPGDLLLLFTDGLTETANLEGDQFGPQRVQEVVARLSAEPSQVVVQQLFETVYEFAHGRAIADDITAIAIKMTA